MWFAKLIGPGSNFGSIIAAMGCAACFPAIAGLGSAIGLGFLAQYEGLFINTLLPVFAWLALIASFATFYRHRKWQRLLVGVSGPLMVLATLYVFWTDDWSTAMFYLGLVMMCIAAIWELFSPARSACLAKCKTHQAVINHE